MKRAEIEKYAEFVLSKFGGKRPGEILRTMSLANGIRKQYPLEYHQGIKVLNLLYLNGLIKHNDNVFSSLTDKGYVSIQDRVLPPLAVDLQWMCNSGQSREKMFYDLWDVIGTGKDEGNPYYVSGTTFYDTIHGALEGLPPTYSSYISSLPTKENGQMPSRMTWYKDLFMRLSDDQVEPFLNRLSDKINDCVTQSVAAGNCQQPTQEVADMDNISEEIKQDIMHKPKVFISHKTEDSGYAKALVDMMVKLGMKYEDIFCSSHPGCGVIFGDGILNAIRQQYDEYELLVLFIHSPRYYGSAVSLNEMGAAWILKSSHLSFLTKDCTFDMLKGVITPNETAFRAGQSNTYHLLHDFRQKLENMFHLNKVNDAVWDAIRTDFIATVENC